jgi:hypothetical protein
VLLGRIPNSNFTPGLLPILWAHGHLGFRGPKSNLISGAFTHR